MCSKVKTYLLCKCLGEHNFFSKMKRCWENTLVGKLSTFYFTFLNLFTIFWKSTVSGIVLLFLSNFYSFFLCPLLGHFHRSFLCRTFRDKIFLGLNLWRTSSVQCFTNYPYLYFIKKILIRKVTVLINRLAVLSTKRQTFLKQHTL